MYHYLYKIYFQRIKKNFSNSENFVIKCLDFFEIMDTNYNGFLDIDQALKCMRVIEISNGFLKHNYNTYKHRFNNKHKNEMEKIRAEIKRFNAESDNLGINKKIGSLWDELDIATKLWRQENCKFYFKDILNIIASNPNINNFYIKNINKFLRNFSTICCCGNMINVHKISDCYENRSVICDFTNQKILNDETLHCHRKSYYHPFGFDIDININDRYIEDKIKRNLVNKIYFKLREINSDNKDIIEDNNVSIHYQDNGEYKKLKYKYHQFCKDILKETTTLYVCCKNELISLLENNNEMSSLNLSSVIKLKCKLYSYKRIMKTSPYWYEHTKSTVEKINKLIDEQERFINNLEPYPFMFENKEKKQIFVDKCRNTYHNYNINIKLKLLDLQNQNDLSYDILGKDSFKEYWELLEKVDLLMYKFYESIEILENATVNSELLDYEIIESNNLENIEDKICTICQDDVTNEMFTVKLKKCSHYFHQKCIDNWLIRSNTCPLCR